MLAFLKLYLLVDFVLTLWNEGCLEPTDSELEGMLLFEEELANDRLSWTPEDFAAQAKFDAQLTGYFC